MPVVALSLPAMTGVATQSGSARTISRRSFLTGATTAGAAMICDAEPSFQVIDIHQHGGYHGRTTAELLAHQKAMGANLTFLLPAGSPVNLPSTHHGRSNGLAAGADGCQRVFDAVRQFPQALRFFANEVPDLTGARKILRAWLRRGAIGIGELKFALDLDSRPMEEVYRLAGEMRVPVLLHIEHQRYCTGFERFHRVLEKFPSVNFIGHAGLFWGGIDAGNDPADPLPSGPVRPGGYTDRLLSDHSNLFADLSGGAGLNALRRDPDFMRGFLLRHPRRLLFGSDCPDTAGTGEACTGAGILAAVRKLSPDESVTRRILGANAAELFRLE